MDRIERHVILPVSAGEVWRVLTEDLSAWFGAEASVERLAPGGHIEFRFPDGSTRAAVIEEVTPERLLAFRWLPFVRGAGGVPVSRAATRVEISLEAQGEGTALQILEAGSGRVGGPMWAEAR